MIYPDVSAKEWCDKYGIDEFSNVCDCGRVMKADIPFLEKDWAGLISKSCECGSPCISTAVPLDKETQDLVNILFD